MFAIERERGRNNEKDSINILFYYSIFRSHFICCLCRRVYWSYMRQLWDEGNTNTTEGIGGGGGGGGGSDGHSTGQPATGTGTVTASVASTNTLQRDSIIEIASEGEVEKEVSHDSYHDKCLSEDMLRDEVLLEVMPISVDNIIISLLVMVLH